MENFFISIYSKKNQISCHNYCWKTEKHLNERDIIDAKKN